MRKRTKEAIGNKIDGAVERARYRAEYRRRYQEYAKIRTMLVERQITNFDHLMYYLTSVDMGCMIEKVFGFEKVSILKVPKDNLMRMHFPGLFFNKKGEYVGRTIPHFRPDPHDSGKNLNFFVDKQD